MCYWLFIFRSGKQNFNNYFYFINYSLIVIKNDIDEFSFYVLKIFPLICIINSSVKQVLLQYVTFSQFLAVCET